MINLLNNKSLTKMKRLNNIGEFKLAESIIDEIFFLSSNFMLFDYWLNACAFNECKKFLFCQCAKTSVVIYICVNMLRLAEIDVLVQAIKPLKYFKTF